MQDDDRPEKPQRQGFLSSLLEGAIRDGLMLWGAVGIGCVLGAIVCLYYGLPLIFALAGGALVMAVFVAWNNL